jgi:hypothetical protein
MENFKIGDKVTFTDKTNEKLTGEVREVEMENMPEMLAVTCHKPSWNMDISCLVPKKTARLVKSFLLILSIGLVACNPNADNEIRCFECGYVDEMTGEFYTHDEFGAKFFSAEVSFDPLFETCAEVWSVEDDVRRTNLLLKTYKEAYIEMLGTSFRAECNEI